MKKILRTKKEQERGDLRIEKVCNYPGYGKHVCFECWRCLRCNLIYEDKDKIAMLFNGNEVIDCYCVNQLWYHKIINFVFGTKRNCNDKIYYSSLEQLEKYYHIK